MRPLTATTALVLAFAGTACSQEDAQPSSEAAPEVIAASASDDDTGGFNLMMPGDDAAGSGGYDGFNLSIPGEDAGNGILLPERAEGDSALSDVPEFATPQGPAPAAESPPPADDLIRIDPAD